MKSTVADYETIVYCTRIEATDGTIVRFASYPHNLTMSNGDVYLSDQGFDFTGFEASSSQAASLLDLEGILSIAGIPRDEIIAGNWDSARAYVFATSWAAPVVDEEPIGKFFFGKARLYRDRYVTEFMHLIDVLNQSVGRVVTPTCTYVLFDETLDGDVIPWTRSRCTGPRDSNADGPLLSDFLETGTVTHVTSQKVWRDDTRAEAAGYFDYGAVKFTTGDNAGLRSQNIKTYAANGTVTQYDAWPYPVQEGDEYDMIPGCNRLRDDPGGCEKYANKINFGGFADLIALSEYQKRGTGAL